MFVTEKAPGELLSPIREKSELDEASKLLLKAAVLMELRGLAQYTTCDDDGSVCVRGALLIAEGIAPKRDKGFGPGYYWQDAGNAAYEADRRLGTALDANPVAWNNARGRTVGEVVAKLHAVALGG